MITARWFFALTNIAFYIAITFPRYERSTIVFDHTISKLYLNNEECIGNYANKVSFSEQKLFSYP